MFKDVNELAKIIDHSFLKPDTTINDIEKLCKEAIQNNFYSVCVTPWWVKKAKELLRHSKVKVCAAIGFPFGMTNIKRQEVIASSIMGVDEVDMVIAIGALKSKFYTDVGEDISSVVQLGLPVKVIIETSFLDEQEILDACDICIEAQAKFVKTNTGFFKDGANAEIIKMIKKHVENKIEIKASGGIDSYEKLISMVEAGATRIGSSNSVKIIKEFMEKK